MNQNNESALNMVQGKINTNSKYKKTMFIIQLLLYYISHRRFPGCEVEILLQ